MNVSDARWMIDRLASFALARNSADWASGNRDLVALDGRELLLVDEMARQMSYVQPEKRGVLGSVWGGVRIDEPTGFVAAVASMHRNGHVREFAVDRMTGIHTPVVAVALALRAVDHVPQVREKARGILLDHLEPDAISLVLDVLLAAGLRAASENIVELVTNRLRQSTSFAEVVDRLLLTDRRRVRRWAHVVAHEEGLLPPERLVALFNDVDQWLRRSVMPWAQDRLDTRQLDSLAHSRSAGARLFAATTLSNDHLSTDLLELFMLDPSARVREVAITRARDRGCDPALVYRSALASSTSSPREKTSAIAELGRVGDSTDRPMLASALSGERGTRRRAGISSVLARFDEAQAIELLAPLLLDPLSSVSASAARALTQLDASPDVAEAAWASPRASDRRAARVLARARHGWFQVDADLRAMVNEDPDVAAMGRESLVEWIHSSAAGTFATPNARQLERILELVPISGLSAHLQRTLLFHAGIRA